MKGDSPKPGIEEVLRLVVEDTASETSSEFFRALVRNLAQVLGMKGAWVTEYLPREKKLRALPAMLNTAQTAVLLGLADHDIPVLGPRGFPLSPG